MKILMLGSKEYPFGVSARHDPKAGGGIEVHVEKLSKYLSRSGHDVHIITRRFPGQPQYEKKGRIHVYRTRYLRNRFLRAFTYNLLAFLSALALIRRERIDLIHAHAVTAGFFGSLLSKLARRPMVFTPHGTIVDWRFPVREILLLLQKTSLLCASRIVFISRSAQENLSWRTGKPSALLTNAIDIEDYDLPLPRGPPTFLYLGRLEEIKGILDLIDAFAIVLKKHPRARLLVAGEGSIKNRVINRIVALKTDRIRYLGWTDSRKALKQAQFFVLPSRESGQPIALLEAMASARTIITSLPLIRDRGTGLRCKPNDPEDLARVMLKAAKTPSRFRKLGLAARKEASRTTWSSAVKLFEREYGKVFGY